MDSNKMKKLGAVLMLVFAAATIIMGAINVSKSVNSMEDVPTEQMAVIEAQMADLGITVDQALDMVMLIGIVVMVFSTVFLLPQIIVALKALIKPDRAAKFYQTWGIVVLVIGALSILFSTTGLLRLFRLVGSVAAPILWILASKKMKAEAQV